MNYWLLKTEPSAFSLDDLLQSPNQTTSWDGVRNYQARNFMRDTMKNGDLAFFYHSNTKPTGIVAVCEVVKESYPDATAFDAHGKYFDPKSDPRAPRWFMVDVKFKKKFPQVLTLAELKQNPLLEGMKLLARGMRLSVQPVDKKHWEIILQMGQVK